MPSIHQRQLQYSGQARPARVVVAEVSQASFVSGTQIVMIVAEATSSRASGCIALKQMHSSSHGTRPRHWLRFVHPLIITRFSHFSTTSIAARVFGRLVRGDNTKQPEDVALRVSPAFPDLKLLSPVVHRGVACMSFGWVNAKAGVPGAGGHGAAVMRGPMVSKVNACPSPPGYGCVWLCSCVLCDGNFSG